MPVGRHVHQDSRAMQSFAAHQFGGRQKLVDSNMVLFQAAYQWAADNLEKTDPYRVESRDLTQDQLLITGNEAAAYLNRGTGHNRYAVYSEKAQDWEENMARLVLKFESARQLMPEAIVDAEAENEVAIIAYGSTLPAVEEARVHLAEEGRAVSLLRLRALPINDTVSEFVAQHQRVYVVELNRDGQMHQILASEMPELATRLISLAHLDGMPLDANWLVEKMKEMENGE